jgi:hypothetical protein
MTWPEHVESIREDKLMFMGKDCGRRFLQNLLFFSQRARCGKKKLPTTNFTSVTTSKHMQSGYNFQACVVRLPS